jgi:hypothetical protein
VIEILLFRRICMRHGVYVQLDKQRGARSPFGVNGHYGHTGLPCLHLEPAVKVSRVQRESVASAEYKIILMPGFACIRPTLNR